MSTIIGYYTNIVGPYGMRYLLDTDLNQVWGHYTPHPHQVKQGAVTVNHLHHDLL